MSGEYTTPSQEGTGTFLDTFDQPVETSDKLESNLSTDGSKDESEQNENHTNTEVINDNPAQDIEQLQKAYSILSHDHEILKGQYMRIAADFDNFRKRQTRDQEDLRLQLICSNLEAILPIVDNFERARQQLDPQTEEGQGLHLSYQGLYKQLVDVLKQLGVAPMRVEGESFDPNLHEAILREPSDIYSEDIIIEELQRGYHLSGRVLRHALVKVSMGPGCQTSPDDSIGGLDKDTLKQEDIN
uniref:GrpE protein homolog n=1 Tax=Paulinella chromatophora TaxID=39717 RepID=B1X4I3_PAUCH|nr:Heat shock protein GrpE [Paulinella chromatophora]ACB42852.1 Heat shock protein GrpE [Paulinella chromatophora]